jgi:DhnA family fructose-bisphosphate aldolase class Ia
MSGKTLRLGRIFSVKDGRAVVIALDHGAIAGPLPGIEKPADTIAACVAGGADAVLATRGFVKAAQETWNRGLGLILRISGGFTVLGGGFEEEIIGSPESALAEGADCAGITVKFGHSREGEFIRQAALAAERCDAIGLPVMIEAMAYREGASRNDPESIALVARAAQEIGADIVKTRYTGDPDSFRTVVEGCQAPILILGGEKADNKALFSDVYWSIQAGGAGVAIGRNIWSSGNTLGMVEAMVGIVHRGWTIEMAFDHITEHRDRC